MLEQIVRAKGFAWLVTHNDLTILIAQVRKSVAIEPIVYWIAALSEKEKSRIFNEEPELLDEWDAEFGGSTHNTCIYRCRLA
ncbi:GTP-binding protein [Bacillus sp. NPDC093026]|uniref:GTP-binding protein n=1 Tax=Bacillus sp. NPDC093026 TaxID=3363948 RepID=UPI003812FD59